MRVCVVGGGKVGYYLAKTLLEHSHEVVLIEINKQTCASIANELDIPVICYGLRTDFQMNLFEGSMWLLAWADKIEELKTVCWCGSGARCNARIDSNGNMVSSGEQVELGANERYISLCRKHFIERKTGPDEKENS